MGLIIDGQWMEEKESLEPVTFEKKQHFDVDESQEGELKVKETTELGDALENLNNDNIEAGRMSGIDMRSRLHYAEISAILGVDSLVAFKFLPVDCLAFTRQKKRLAVSLSGEGRKEIVEIVGGKQDVDAKKAGGFGSSLRGFFGGNKNES